MSKLILPNLIQVKLVKSPEQDFPLDNILLYIKTNASHKNDFYLGPFVSDNNGVITITKANLDNEVAATYDSGLMDYSSIESNFSFVELRLYDQDEIDKLIESRTKAWTTLLKGEKERWDSINRLVDILRKSNNKLLLLHDSTRRIRAEFDGAKDEYEFQLDIYKK
jgi:hypothetical protein